MAASGSLPASNSAANLTLASGTSGVTLLMSDTTAQTKQIRIEAALVLDPFTPMHGTVPMKPDIEVLVDGLESWTVKGDSESAATNFGFPAKADQTYNGAGVFQLGKPPSWVGGMANAGGYMGFAWALHGRGVRARNGGRLPKDGEFASHPSGPASVLNEQYPFVSEPVTVNVKQTSGALVFSGGPLTISIRQRSTGDVIQNLTMDFPPTTLPAPTLYTTGSTATKYWTFQTNGSGLGTSGRLAGANGPDYHPGRAGSDVIYSLVAGRNGQTLDPRFLAMTGTGASASLFLPHPNYVGSGTSTARSANTLIYNPVAGIMFIPPAAVPNNGTLARLPGTTKMNFTLNPAPKVPVSRGCAAVDNGDWDNGIGWMPDGGFLNLPDQGALPTKVAGFGQTPYFNNSFDGGGDDDVYFTEPHDAFARDVSARCRLVSRGGEAGRRCSSDVNRLTRDTRRRMERFASNPDYLMLDYFWMPVVEPYAISEPLSTAGKINMNFQIVPFTYIERSTGLYAVLETREGYFRAGCGLQCRL